MDPLVYECLYCQYIFTKRSNLERHLRDNRCKTFKTSNAFDIYMLCINYIRKTINAFTTQSCNVASNILITENRNDNELTLCEDTELDNLSCQKGIQYVYMVKEREFIRSKEDIFKIGKTTQQPFKRLNTYPKGSSVELLLTVTDCSVIEAVLIAEFKKTFVQRKDIGAEYFEGDLKDLKKKMFEIVMKLDATH